MKEGVVRLKIRFPLATVALSLIWQCCAAFLSGAIADFLFTVWMVAYLPTVSFFYAKKYLPGGKISVPFTLAHSFLLALSFFIFYITREGLAMALLLFAWCELWAMIGLIRKQKIPCF